MIHRYQNVQSFRPVSQDPRQITERSITCESPPKRFIFAQITVGLKECYDRIRNGKQKTNNLNNQATDEEEFSPIAGSILAGRYKVIAKVGEGQSSVMVKSQDMFHPDRRHVAIKILHASYGDLGPQEASCLLHLKKADSLKVANIAHVLNMFMVGRHFCIVFKFLSPISICKYFQMFPFPSKEEKMNVIRRVAFQVTQCLAVLSSLNIIHSDIKPENILFTKGKKNNVKVIDFGNAIYWVHDEMSLYFESFELQTVFYRAPEVMFGLPFGPPIDMWSLGCVLAELYLGEPLFLATSKEEMLEKMQALFGPVPSYPFQCGKYFSNFKKFVGRVSPEPVSSKNVGNIMKKIGSTDYMFADFLARLLTFDPNLRVTPMEAVRHQFLAYECPMAYMLPSGNFAQGPRYSSILLTQNTYQHRPKIDEEIKRLHYSPLDLLRIGTQVDSKMDIVGPRNNVMTVSPFNYNDEWKIANNGEKHMDTSTGNRAEGRSRDIYDGSMAEAESQTVHIEKNSSGRCRRIETAAICGVAIENQDTGGHLVNADGSGDPYKNLCRAINVRNDKRLISVKEDEKYNNYNESCSVLLLKSSKLSESRVEKKQDVLSKYNVAIESCLSTTAHSSDQGIEHGIINKDGSTMPSIVYHKGVLRKSVNKGKTSDEFHTRTICRRDSQDYNKKISRKSSDNEPKSDSSPPQKTNKANITQDIPKLSMVRDVCKLDSLPISPNTSNKGVLRTSSRQEVNAHSFRAPECKKYYDKQNLSKNSEGSKVDEDRTKCCSEALHNDLLGKSRDKVYITCGSPPPRRNIKPDKVCDDRMINEDGTRKSSYKESISDISPLQKTRTTQAEFPKTLSNKVTENNVRTTLKNKRSTSYISDIEENVEVPPAQRTNIKFINEGGITQFQKFGVNNNFQIQTCSPLTTHNSNKSDNEVKQKPLAQSTTNTGHKGRQPNATDAEILANFRQLSSSMFLNSGGASKIKNTVTSTVDTRKDQKIKHVKSRKLNDDVEMESIISATQLKQLDTDAMSKNACASKLPKSMNLLDSNEESSCLTAVSSCKQVVSFKNSLATHDVSSSVKKGKGHRNKPGSKKSSNLDLIFKTFSNDEENLISSNTISKQEKSTANGSNKGKSTMATQSIISKSLEFIPAKTGIKKQAPSVKSNRKRSTSNKKEERLKGKGSNEETKKTDIESKTASRSISQKDIPSKNEDTFMTPNLRGKRSVFDTPIPCRVVTSPAELLPGGLSQIENPLRNAEKEHGKPNNQGVLKVQECNRQARIADISSSQNSGKTNKSKSIPLHCDIEFLKNEQALKNASQDLRMLSKASSNLPEESDSSCLADILMLTPVKQSRKRKAEYNTVKSPRKAQSNTIESAKIQKLSSTSVQDRQFEHSKSKEFSNLGRSMKRSGTDFVKNVRYENVLEIKSGDKKQVIARTMASTSRDASSIDDIFRREKQVSDLGQSSDEDYDVLLL